MKPVLKWAGGKRLLIPEIIKHINKDEIEKNGNRYFEPFIGGGAVCFELMIAKTVINDTNSELINVYTQIKENPEELIELLKTHREKYNSDYYEYIRSLDREPNFHLQPAVFRASRFIFLNKTCYNGLYRVNSSGFFNVPEGKYKNPDIVNDHKIHKLSRFFNEKNVTIRNLDFEKSVNDAKCGDVVYFDPPYDYEAEGFTAYSSAGFDRGDLTRLKQVCDDLIMRGCKVIISNNDTPFVNVLFTSTHYQIHRIEANRFINCDGTNRKKVKEVIIYGERK
ncbi:MAG: Dam family site-specific DNA-(adenine-N6)-methyltransferase [Candidatus Izemoplasmatales bacterium]|nr:Dam family site-specific DNA-(adenine-N6)-methyltransferase [Candidatus Izemoplasmatales bacterium]